MSEIEDVIGNLQQQLKQEQSKTHQLGQAAHSLMQQQETNLIQWQLELDNILEKIEHLLRGDELKMDAKGNYIWKTPASTDGRIFNEKGVQEILRILQTYLNRNTILSHYDEATINWKVYDLGYELTDLIFMKYENMFAYSSEEELKEKCKLYPMIIKEVIDTIHSAYNRALRGGERESLRTARTVTQTEPLGMQQSLPGVGGISKTPFNLFNAKSWFK